VARSRGWLGLPDREGRCSRRSSSGARAPSAETREIFLGQVCPGLEFDTIDDWVRISGSGGLTDIETETGPFEMMTPRGFLADEGLLRSAAIMSRVMARPANLRKMAWPMPRMAKAVPYLGHLVVTATKAR
jgi:hypothetical protein